MCYNNNMSGKVSPSTHLSVHIENHITGGTNMNVTKEKALKMLIEMAGYIHLADVFFAGESFEIEDGKVLRVILNEETRDLERKEVITTVQYKPVSDIVEFLKAFILFSEETKCTVDPMILNTPDDEWEWVVNARACCGKAMVRYKKRYGLVFDPEKDADRIMELGFEKTFPKGILKLF